MGRKIIFVSGGTGYLGRAMVEGLAERGHRVRVLVREGSERKVPPHAELVTGNALESATFLPRVEGCDTFVHLTGVAHPAPWKEQAFRAIDLVSLRASARAAQAAGVRHFVYVSVAQPAPVMQAYLRVRQECEEILKEAGFLATILRPWYVLGEGHRWPALLKPVYALLEALPSTRSGALRLGLVTHAQMVAALEWAVEHPGEETQVLDVAAIRRIGSATERGV